MIFENCGNKQFKVMFNSFRGVKGYQYSKLNKASQNQVRWLGEANMMGSQHR